MERQRRARDRCAGPDLEPHAQVCAHPHPVGIFLVICGRLLFVVPSETHEADMSADARCNIQLASVIADRIGTKTDKAKGKDYIRFTPA